MLTRIDVDIEESLPAFTSFNFYVLSSVYQDFPVDFDVANFKQGCFYISEFELLFDVFPYNSLYDCGFILFPLTSTDVVEGVAEDYLFLTKKNNGYYGYSLEFHTTQFYSTSQIEELQKQVNVLTEEKADLSSQIRSLNNQIDNLNKQISNLDKENIDYEQKILELQKQVNDFNSIVNSLNNTISQRDTTISQLNQQIIDTAKKNYEIGYNKGVSEFKNALPSLFGSIADTLKSFMSFEVWGVSLGSIFALLLAIGGVLFVLKIVRG